MKIYRNEPMAPHTTFRIGGRAQRLFELCSRDDLRELRETLNGKMDRVFFLGKGSNLLIREGKVMTPFVRLAGDFLDLSFDESSVTAGGAVPMPELAMKSARKNFYGLEWAAGVPGSVGGAVMMNAGAFEHETYERLQSVRVMDREGEIYDIPSEDIDFDYRFCGLRDDYLILEATFQLEPAPADAAMDNTRTLIEKRRNQQPVGHPSAGCIFKNGKDFYAAELIDRAGLKGESEGQIYVSEQHANYMINRGDGSYQDVLRLIELVRDRISEEFDKELELELCVVDE